MMINLHAKIQLNIYKRLGKKCGKLFDRFYKRLGKKCGRLFDR